jgi:CubicO group peptidase (beta-lactamase class C family)
MTQTSEASAAQRPWQAFEEYIRATMQDWQLPGLAIAIVEDDEVIFSRGFGKRDLARDLDVTPRTLFAIGSCTKAFTTTALGMLVEEGKLDWDKPVREYLPTFKLHDPVATEQMTARDLVVHRSGLPRHDLMWYNSHRTRQELFDRLRYLEPSKGFREVWQYQNLMYMVAGYLLEQISGQSWEDFIRERIFTPLEMTGSNFSVHASQQSDDFAMPYHKVKDEVEETDFFSDFEAIAPAGAINSNVEEMSKWMLLQLHRGKYRDRQIISEAQIAQLHTPQMMVLEQPRKYAELSYVSYAHGWMVTSYRGHLMVQHSGGIDGFSALTTLLPDDNIGIVVLTNMGNCPVHTIVTFNACDRLFGLNEIDWNERVKKDYDEMVAVMRKSREQNAADRIPDTHPSHSLDAYTGDFEHPGYGTIAVKQEGDHLALTFNDMAIPLTHHHYDIFEAAVERFDLYTKVSFATNVKGDIESLALTLEPAVPEIVFKRAPDRAMQEKSFLEQFVGEYATSGITLTVTLRGDKTLFASVPGQPDYELVPYKGTSFQLKDHPGFGVEFKRDDAGQVSAMIVRQPYGVITAQKKSPEEMM